VAERDAAFPADGHALYEQRGYSAAIRSGSLLFVSGQVGSRADGTPEPDVALQVQRAFDSLEATLAAAGCGFDDIVDLTSFHTDLAQQFAAIMAVTNRVFTETPYPTWTAVGVTWLAGFDFEIKVIARIPAADWTDVAVPTAAAARRLAGGWMRGGWTGHRGQCPGGGVARLWVHPPR
jgi:enamine deaminase RidA (YjgF/YER057c/UK114 family)